MNEPSDAACTLHVEDDVPMAQLTSLGVGGPARHLASCHGEEDLLRARDFARQRKLPIFVLGGGSNLLVSDDGFDGVVVRLIDDRIEMAMGGGDDHVVVAAGAGARWDPFVDLCVGEGLAGLECLSGIPGLVGAAPIQNIGAYGQEVAESVVAIDVFDLELGTTRRMSNSDCDFGYRTSRFKSGDPGVSNTGIWQPSYAVLRVHFRLRRRASGHAAYPDLRRRLGLSEGSAAPPLAAVRAAVLDIRRGKSMVIDPEIAEPNDPNRRSAGSFFVNPVAPPDVAAAILRRCRELDLPAPPSWPVADGRVKLAAAWLIEAAGFAKGHRKGPAAISTNHALALVNLGDARAADFIALAAEIRAGVFATFGIQLEPEPVLLGFS